MKSTPCLLLAFALAGPALAADPETRVGVAVLDFKADWHTDYRLDITHSGEVFSALLAQDLSVLKPLTVVGRDEKGANLAGERTVGDERMTPAAAKALGDSLRASALVTGQLFRSKTQLIIAAKVVLTATGQTSGTLVQGDPSIPLADLTARLGAQIANLILYQADSAPRQWKPASIVGSGGPEAPADDDETAYVAAIDGKPVADAEKRQKEPFTLLPGTHELVVRGENSKPGYSVRFAIQALPNARYQVHYRPRGDGPPAVAQAIPMDYRPTVWIHDLNSGTSIRVLVEIGTESKWPPVVFSNDGFEAYPSGVLGSNQGSPAPGSSGGHAK